MNSIIKRNGIAVSFDAAKIKNALLKCIADVRGKGAPYSFGQADNQAAESVTQQVVAWCQRQDVTAVHIENVQDQVELALMRSGEHDLARGYVLYREKQAELRKSVNSVPAIHYVDSAGRSVPFDAAEFARYIDSNFSGFDLPAAASIAAAVERQLFEGCSFADLQKARILAARQCMEQYPDATYLAACFVIEDLKAVVLAGSTYPGAFEHFIRVGIQADLLDERLAQFDLKKLGMVIDPDADKRFDYLGLETIRDRYLLNIKGEIIELPQFMYMRVAMGLALNEIDRDARAIEFYHQFSSNRFMSSTPTLFNSGTRRPQLSSCYLTTIGDDLESIYDGIKENAMLQKYAGGLGNDWSRVRAMGAHIKGTNGASQGVIPFLKVVNDTAIAVNQGGKRKGAVCGYLESWHLDIEEFLELRKNTGDDRRRTHDMNTANWVPDLFMKRVKQGGTWTLFSPNEVPDLHELYGKAFEQAYTAYEQKADAGKIRNFKRIEAKDLWRKMLSMLFETGHPWITFKDPCNIRSPQKHVGVVHSSNLCTEITLNTSDTETAVCNLGSVNLLWHINPTTGQIDKEKLRQTIRVAMRMLDNVVDVNLYPSAKARRANLTHRPVGLGIMGFHDMLQAMGVSYASEDAVAIADKTQEVVCLYAYLASTELAEERGRYASFNGSLWDQGIFPHHTIAILEEERGMEIGVKVTREGEPEWFLLADRIQKFGMRNSNCCAIAPTATISNIVGVSQSIDPIFENLYVKSNLGGEFTMVNRSLHKKLKERGLWDAAMVMDLKSNDGSVALLDRVPLDMKALYATAFEIEPNWLIRCAAERQKWIDQAQSLNLYLMQPSGKKLEAMYMSAWEMGLKTTYYLRTKSASQAEKATGHVGRLNAVKMQAPQPEQVGPACTMRPGDPGFETCESCQ